MDTLTLTSSQYHSIIQRLESLEIAVGIKKKKKTQSKKIGSELWWEKAHTQAIQDISKEKYTVIKSKKELKKHLDSLK